MKKNFTFVAYDASGVKHKGQVEAENEKIAVELLTAKKLIPLSVRPVQSAFSFFNRGGGTPSNADIEFFTQEIALLLKSGIKIDRAIEVIKKSTNKPSFEKILNDLHHDVKRGIALNVALKKYPDIFSSLYVNLVEIGESTGNLPSVFLSLADDLKFKGDLRKKTIQALSYPSVIFGVCILCMYFVFVFIVPQMSTLFDNVPVLPWYTEVILGISSWITSNQLLLLVIVMLGVSAIIVTAKKGLLHPLVNWSMLNLPLLKTLARMLESTRFNSSMSLMLNAGVVLDRAMALAIGSVKQPSYRNELKAAADKIKKGEGLTHALSATSLFGSIYKSLLEVGEESGKLDVAFFEIARRQKVEFEDWTLKLTTILEPLLILFMGAIVGGVVVTMLMSMVAVNDVSF